jgi:hypothetical protein
MAKVSYGELDKDDATARTRIRHAFLSKVAELAPGVWSELYEATEETYRTLKAEHPEEYFSRDIENFGQWPPIVADRTAEVYDRYPRLSELIDLIDGWANRWNLVSSDPNDPWVVKVVLAHLEYWNTHGREGEYLALGFGGFGPIPMTLNAPPGFQTYNPLLTTRVEYLNIVGADASQRINNDPVLTRMEASQKTASIKSIIESMRSYCDRVEAHFEEAGFVRGGEKRELAQHLEWAVTVRLKAATQASLATEAQKAGRRATPQAVSKAVKQLLRFIGLK